MLHSSISITLFSSEKKTLWIFFIKNNQKKRQTTGFTVLSPLHFSVVKKLKKKKKKKKKHTHTHTNYMLFIKKNQY